MTELTAPQRLLAAAPHRMLPVSTSPWSWYHQLVRKATRLKCADDYHIRQRLPPRQTITIDRQFHPRIGAKSYTSTALLVLQSHLNDIQTEEEGKVP